MRFWHKNTLACFCPSVKPLIVPGPVPIAQGHNYFYSQLLEAYMIVCKFGGSSLASVQAIRRTVEIIGAQSKRARPVAVVVSAIGGVTDELIALARLAETRDVTWEGRLIALKERHIQLLLPFIDTDKTDGATVLDEISSMLEDLEKKLGAISLLGELSARSLDSILSFGERLSAHIVQAALSASGIHSGYLDARKIIKTDSEYGNAHINMALSEKAIQDYFSVNRDLAVVTGFIASDSQGRTTTLGRGGSDLSAALIASAVGAKEIHIWTDVDGILSADPHLVKTAFSLARLSYSEAMELSHFGAKVLYPPSILPALARGIPIRILNTFKPEAPGSIISCDDLGAEQASRSPEPRRPKPSSPEPNRPEPRSPVKGISSIHAISLVRLQGPGMVGVRGVSSRLFASLARAGISVILITQASSEHSICFAIRPEEAAAAKQAISSEFEYEIARAAIEEPLVESELSIIAVVGAGMKQTPGIAGKVFHALGRNGINIVAIAQGSSELNISAVVRQRDESKALNAIHEAFFLSGRRTVHVFMVGVGLIGSTLLQQIARQQEALESEYGINLRLVGLANSQRMAFSPEGIAPGRAKDVLLNGPETGDSSVVEVYAGGVSAFIEKMRNLNLPNTAFCDCTANEDIAKCYVEVLEASIPVITPNKRANSASYEYYSSLRDVSRTRGIPYLYETTVCAGLPVISTIKDLVLAGDKISSIEAVVSGTLSYIFNNFDGTVPFSQLVRQAKEKGYTEPDPREDLNAMDAARKALILAREAGMALEFEDISIEPILPEAALAAESVEAFFLELEKADAQFEARRRAAADKGRFLRYVARIDAQGARLGMAELGPDSPFSSLVDADNLVVVFTKRYNTLPLVVRGPGAGAEVTAGGIFADIVRIARTLV